jgi:hypothetical protein
MAKLVGTTVGWKNHGTVEAHAAESMQMLYETSKTRWAKDFYPAITGWMERTGVRFAQRGEAEERFMREVGDYVRGFDREFDDEVKRAGEATRRELANFVNYINDPNHGTGKAKKRGLTEDVIKGEDGVETVIGTLLSDPHYLPRRHDAVKWNALVAEHGREAVTRWWANAHKAARPEVSDERAMRFAKWFVTTIEDTKVNRQAASMDMMLRGQDKEALIESLKRNSDFTDAEITEIMADLFPKKGSDAGNMPSSMKHRNTINERHTETWTLPDGTEREVTINDFIDTNISNVMDDYLRKTSGAVAIARHFDAYSMSQIDSAIQKTVAVNLGDTGFAVADREKAMKLMRFAVDRVLGLPVEDFSSLGKALQMWRNYNIIRLMGGTVYNQMVEWSQMIGVLGWRGVFEAVQEVRQMRRDAKTGRLGDDLLDILEERTGGMGTEYLRRMDFSRSDDWVRNKGDTRMNRLLDRVDNAGQRMAQGVLDYTGMTPLMILQKRVFAKAMTNHVAKLAHGLETATYLSKERLAWMGLSEEAFGRVKAGIRQFGTHENGRNFKLDFDAFRAADPESYDKFMRMIHRESRRVIQENDIAAMIPVMGTSLGQTMFQFMNFSMQGWNKSLAFAVNHKDWATVSTVMWGSVIAAAVYMARTQAQAAGMDEEDKAEFLERRLSHQQIAANSFGRISQASLLPAFIDTLSPFPLFSGMKTTSDLSSFASNPTLQAVNTLIGMKKLARNGLSDEYQTTARDVRAWSKLLPLSNVPPVVNLINLWASDYPTNENQED